MIRARQRATRRCEGSHLSLAFADPLDDGGLRDFKDFCEIDGGLSKARVRWHGWRLRKFLEFLDKPLCDIHRGDVRSFLTHMKENYTPGYYSTFLKALRVFFRDYLGRGEVVSPFKFPTIPVKPKRLPTREELRRFYEALSDLRMKVLFLFHATSGLRRSEVLGCIKKMWT